MLLSAEKKVLSKVIEISHKKHGKSAYFSIGSAKDIQEKIPKFNINQIEQILLSLDAKGLIDVVPADNTICHTVLTYEGEKYTESNWIDFKKFLLTSIFTPIVISVVTAIITSYVYIWFKLP